jgi:LAO/AO transport system kinase
MLAHRNIRPAAAAAIDIEALAEAVVKGRRAGLGRAITLVESKKPEHRQLADRLLQSLHSRTGEAYRIGVTGHPGVGKSTFIDQFGFNLVEAGHRVAVLAVDPSSNRSGGSILGDKTRMQRLAAHPNAFIRPSPAGRTLGGVARTTRETMLICEAAGFDVVIVETVGVGQSESAVAGMVDFFLVLLLPGAGDELQGLKRGLIEIADMIAVNKADGESASQATATAADYRAALHILTGRESDWRPEVVAISARENKGLDDLWSAVRRHRQLLRDSGAFAARRRDQAVTWMHELIEDRLHGLLRGTPAMRKRLETLEQEVRTGRKLPGLAADEILRLIGLDGAPASGR